MERVRGLAVVLSRDRLIAGGLLAVGLAIFAASFTIREGQVSDPLGPRFMPLLVSGLLAVGAVRVITRTAKPGGAGVVDEDEDSETAGVPPSQWRPWAGVLIALAFVALLVLVGYVAAAILASVAVLRLLEVRSLGLLVGLPLLLGPGLWLLFTLVLELQL